MLIPDGTYAAKPITSALGYTKGGKESVGIEFKLTDTGAHITWYGYFTDATTERTIETLRLCGWTGSDMSDLSEIGTTDVDVNLVIEQQEWEGKLSSKVQWVNRAGGLAMAAPLTQDQSRAFAARMKGAVVAFDQRAGAPAPKPRKTPTSNRDSAVDAESDIPF